KDVSLAVDLPRRPGDADDSLQTEVLLLRSTFWQGAGSPFGPRPVWLPSESPSSLPPSTPLSSFPTPPLHYSMDLIDLGDSTQPSQSHLARHPPRPAK